MCCESKGKPSTGAPQLLKFDDLAATSGSTFKDQRQGFRSETSPRFDQYTPKLLANTFPER